MLLVGLGVAVISLSAFFLVVDGSLLMTGVAIFAGASLMHAGVRGIRDPRLMVRRDVVKEVTSGSALRHGSPLERIVAIEADIEVVEALGSDSDGAWEWVVLVVSLVVWLVLGVAAAVMGSWSFVAACAFVAAMIGVGGWALRRVRSIRRTALRILRAEREEARRGLDP